MVCSRLKREKKIRNIETEEFNARGKFIILTHKLMRKEFTRKSTGTQKGILYPFSIDGGARLMDQGEI